ncbi:hypothetical protein [Chamaesiphon minutus]|uniref:Uncharacterized protein n=1 Tax=Chamaesiphon minutus (strain ATCC 27169 / PCC 6605) TaxID=1173020 RepID=K9UI74_CHAP6|nr:hypothetical protein [Chamaesiphon minutus]AFY94338.1 hypothetical protein Cha6605_3336 [Chamaesiphon minutus PCC 6605]
MKLLAYLLGLGAITGSMLLDLTPVYAQIGGGNDNGTGREAISAPRSRNTQSPEAARRQAALDEFSKSLTSNSVGDAALFDVINGGAPAPLVAALLPAGLAADSATSKAATTLADTVRGLRAANGNIDTNKLQASIDAFNDYVKTLVSEIGPDKAVTDAPSGQKALQGLLGRLVQIASQGAAMTPPTPRQLKWLPT